MTVDVNPAEVRAGGVEGVHSVALAASRIARLPTTQELKVALTRFPRVYARARLPYATARYLARRPHDYDYAAFGLFPQSDGLFLDIGANAGMSSMSFRLYQRRATILAIEPNPYHESDLRWTRRVVGRMEYRIWAAGAAAGEESFFVPVFRGVPITAEASISRQFVQESPSLQRQLGAKMQSQEFKIVKLHVEVRRMDDLGLAPVFAKVDVQGYEQPVLSGMRRTLERYGPPVLVEAPGPETQELMADMGYSPYAYEHAPRRLVPLTDQAVTNVLFARSLPSDR